MKYTGEMTHRERLHAARGVEALEVGVLWHVPGQLRELHAVGHLGHALGLIGAALSKNIGVFQSSSVKVVPISPNAS